MSYTYNPPTGLTGVVQNPATQPLVGTLNWSAAITLNGPALLLHCDGTGGSTAFPDSSGNNNAVTSSGVIVTTTDPKFGTGCMELASAINTSNYATIPVASGGSLDFNAGDWTLEFWFNPNSLNGGFIISDVNAGLGSGPVSGPWAINTDGSGLQILFSGPSAYQETLSWGTGILAIGVWNNFAAVKQGNNITLFLNGDIITTGTITLADLYPTSGQIRFGQNPAGSASANALLDEIRITQSALYTANYSVASGPFVAGAAPPGYDVYRNGVSIATFGVDGSLLVSADVGLVDDSGNSTPILIQNDSSNFVRSTAQAKFGPASIYNGGTTRGAIGAAVTPGGPLDISSGDFTIEFWYYLATFGTGVPGNMGGTYQGSPGYGGVITFTASITPSNVTFNCSVLLVSSGSIGINNTTVVTPGSWAHIALVRQGNNFDFFVNGQASGSMSAVSALNLLPAAAINISGAVAPLTGGIISSSVSPAAYTDEYRLVKGLAVYTPGISFTPPTSAFPIGFYATSYVDTVPAYGTYEYQVAAWNPPQSTDISSLSSPIYLTYAGTQYLQAKFVPALNFKGIMVANAGSINPRIYPPERDSTVHVPQQRLPI